MKIKHKLAYILNGMKSYRHIDCILNDEAFHNDRLYGELLRNVHSIEKGLSLRDVRPGFGYSKIIEAISIACELLECHCKLYDEAVSMLADAIHSYLDFHRRIGYSDDNILIIEKEFLEKLSRVCSPSYGNGGVVVVEKQTYSNESVDILESLFRSRHSVRDFSDDAIDVGVLNEAIELAHHCPSACNRQGYRIHIVDKTDFAVLSNWFEGMGGFQDKIDKFVLITGKISLYRREEEMQYIVSASVFASYLTLTLHLKGIGSCFVQRPVVYNAAWENISRFLGISGDEQVVCALGIGNLMQSYRVPVSHRITLDDLVTYH